MSENFLEDLNEYFSKKYEDYDAISTLPSYESVTISMVLKNRNRIEEGEVATNEVRKIYYQPQREKVLEECKERYVDNNFTFSVRVSPWKMRFKAFFGVRALHGKLLEGIVVKYGEKPEAMPEKLGITQEVWKKTLRGWFIPEKVLLYKLGLQLALRKEDFETLMRVCGAYYDFADARDVVVKYLMDYRVFNKDFIDAAFKEFRIRPLF